MSAVEEIQAAIDRLTMWRGGKPAEHITDAIIAEAKTGQPQAQNVLGIVRLSSDRTIDAQLTILRETVFQLSSELKTHGLFGTEHNIIVKLARAINEEGAGDE
jgi:hypothetical protein